MKYKGIVELDVRKYLGAFEEEYNWQHLKYAVGINIEGRVYDYKTLEEYKILTRNDNGVIAARDKDLIVGEIYAIDTKTQNFDIEQKYREYVINNYINSKEYFSDEYKELKPKVKTLLK